MRHRAFTLIELLVVIALVALLVSILLPALASSRRSGRETICSSNLRQISTALHSYGADADNRIATFSWTSTRGQLTGPMAQAIDLLERYASLNDFSVRNWFPHPYYSHLVLSGYLYETLPAPLVVCPDDAPRLSWIDAWQSGRSQGFQNLAAGSQRPASGNERWVFSASYHLVPAGFSADRISAEGGRTVSQSGRTHRVWNVGQRPLGGRRFDEVLFPSSKVAMHDESGRHGTGGRQWFFAIPQSRQPLLFFDGHVAHRKTSDSNPGWDPNQPERAAATRIAYSPEAWEPPTRSGQPRDFVLGVYRWTREGLKGIDFDGREVGGDR